MNAITSILGAMKYVPASVARKALEKVNPKFKNYFSKALAYGVDANRAIDFVMDRFESSAQRRHKEKLETGAANQTLRPDEKASKATMENQAIPGKIAKGALALGVGALAGHEPSEQEEQAPGPQHGPFLPTGEELGKKKHPYGPGHGIIPAEYMYEHGPQPQQKKQTPGAAPSQSPISGQDITKSFPQLIQAVQQRMAKGESVEQAAEAVKNSKLFASLAKRIELTNGLPFSQWVRQELGGNQPRSQNNPASSQKAANFQALQNLASQIAQLKR